jgi:hypothetical protein
MAERGKLSWGGIIGLTALALAGMAVVVALATLLFGGVAGYEFNPQTFERRRFAFFEIPLLRLQVTPLKRTGVSGPVEQSITGNNYVQPDAKAPETWHLISFHRSNYAPSPTDTQILIRYFDAENPEGGNYWQDWTIEKPQLAKLLWPEVARLARLELYVLLPPLFELAREAKDPTQFAKDLNALQAQEAQAVIERLEKQIEATEDAETRARLEQRVDALMPLVEETTKSARPADATADSADTKDESP